MKSRALSCLCGLCLFFLVLGCGKSDPTTSNALPTNPGPTNPGPMAGPPSGNAVFDKNCMGCHAFKESTSPGGPKRKGPNLAKVGAERSVDWLTDHVKDPKSHKAGSKMPEFASKLSAEEIKSVSEFMAGLK